MQPRANHPGKPRVNLQLWLLAMSLQLLMRMLQALVKTLQLMMIL